jgi:primary-amine oxidase
MDAGEYGVGTFTASLEPGLDCPANATFFDAVFADDRGVPFTIKRAVCLFERDSSDIAWRHYESVNGQSESRKRTDLVLRLVSSIGNYDYIFDWVFRQDGTIQVAVGASGIEQVKAVASRTIEDDKDGRDTAYGHMVAEHTVAVNHDHFFCFRLDLDVDGPENCLVIDHFRTARNPAGTPRKSLWKVEMEEPKTEQAARRRINLADPEMWLAVNCVRKGPLGYRSGYALHPDANAVSLLTEDDTAQRRGGFTDYHLWVTPYDPSERYAGGLYPNQSRGGDGLPAWTSADRPILNRDIVLWYTLGFHHMVRAEDWPVLPTAWHTFELRPFDFFDRNPALDLPKQP